MAIKKYLIPKKVGDFLKKNKAKFELLEHKTVYTAFDKAATLRAKPRTIAKVLVVKIDRELAMVIISGGKNLDIEKLKKAVKAKKIDFVRERAIKEHFKGIDPGAVPPFGKLWGIKAFVDRGLLNQPKIIISAGSYEWSLMMAPAAFKKITPDLIVGVFSKAKEKPKKKKKPKNNAKKR